MSRITELENEIRKNQELYYNNEPVISDAEFDALCDELKELDPENPLLTTEVGSDHTEGFKKVKHDIIMGSQSKANTAEEMDEFYNPTKTYMAQYKLDGCSVVLNYKNGKFVNAASRGDGEVGDDISSNVKKMNGFVSKVGNNFTGAVRGEILLDRSVKDKYFPEMKNCRNAAAGIMKHLDGTDCDKLTIRVYDAQYLDKDCSFCMQSVLQNWLKENGFNVAPWFGVAVRKGEWIVNKIKEIFSEENYNKLEYDIDGLVIKQEEIDDDDIQTNYRPKTQIALKPAKVLKETVVTGIKWSVRNGTLTPVVQFEPVDIQGSTVKQASGYNIAFLEEMQLEIGDRVMITKFNMIIPGIMKNITKNTYNQRYV